MPPPVVNGAMLACSFGVTPSAIIVTPKSKVMAGGVPAANIMDHLPTTNILPFGMCSSLANPTVATATATALGVLTPMPCIPVTTVPWAPGVPTVLIAGMPAVDMNCMLACNWGGVIKPSITPAMTVQLP